MTSRSSQPKTIRGKDVAVPHPAIVSGSEWRAQRIKHLKREKRVTRNYDQIAAERRKLPMVRIEKDYFFEGPGGRKHLRDLFDGRRQLIVYHFMFDPARTEGCPGCTGYVNALGDLSLLRERNTHFLLISRAPLAKLRRYAKKQGWTRPWVSSFGSDFNYDFHVTLDEKIAPVEYGYRTKAEMLAHGMPGGFEGEAHGLSVFFRIGDEVYHTYSTYARGVESLTDSYRLLDTTPYGRQEDWEDSPRGWPQKPTYG
ncbi:MAG: hypothetical protein JWM88_3145 [Verrucomicrobia bacterium]|nr:hypothetical protein [Verrucomicrobiota bacterium]